MACWAATASLDRELPRELMSDLVQAAGDRSLLLITHRLEGLEAMDEILVMEEGRIEERGAHAELLASEGRYSQMLALESPPT
jgi:ATP-binding cassette, subfamily C, bacterial CydC